ncbi:MAG: PKD domain-containing protein, partial [Candidatus Thermoplasmatota archaeon]|nr:PKD domain-containing protein [Candidatus Thermoplasmatota archaeon]
MGQVALVTVTHGVPAGAAYGDGDTVTLTAAGGIFPASDSASADSSAGLVRSATITLDDPAGATDPGGNLLIRGNLTNTGNGISSYDFGVTGDSVANGWAELNATSSTLAADTSSSFNLWISVPDNTPASGSYDITVQAHGFGSDTTTFTITSNARSASVSAADTSFRLNPGTSATTVVTVTNTGSVATDYTLVVDSGHDYVRFSTTSFNIAKGGFQAIQMTVIVPSDASSALSAGFTVSPQIDGSSDSATVSINPNLPQDTSGWAIDTASVDSNTQFTFTLTGLAGDFTLDWDFGDGSTVRSDGGLSQSHAYSASGDATVSLIVTDDLGQVTSFSSGFVVTNVPPAVNKPSVSAEGDTAVDGNSVTAVEGTEIEFVLTVPTDSDGSLTLLRVDWGDGTHRAYSGGDLSGPTLNLKHTYWAPGTYQVSVTAVDNSGDETVVQAQEVTARGDRTVLEEGTNQLGLLLLLAVFGLALSATAYHIRKQGFSGDETMNEQERARLSTLEQRMDTVREREELLEVAAYDAARVTTKLEDHLRAFNQILVKAQEVAAEETLSKLEAEEAAAAAAETQRELDIAEPDLELLAERFHGTLGKLVETRTELGTIEEQLAYVLKME